MSKTTAVDSLTARLCPDACAVIVDFIGPTTEDASTVALLCSSWRKHLGAASCWETIVKEEYADDVARDHDGVFLVYDWRAEYIRQSSLRYGRTVSVGTMSL